MIKWHINIYIYTKNHYFTLTHTSEQGLKIHQYYCQDMDILIVVILIVVFTWL